MAEPTGQGTLGHLGSLTTMRLKHGSYSLAGAASSGAVIIDYLVIAGGGSGYGVTPGQVGAGGGGAGGYRTSVTGQLSGQNSIAQTKITYSIPLTIVVGAGGAFGTTLDAMGLYSGNPGGLSSAGTVTTVGGASGNWHSLVPSLQGGSGGGATDTTYNAGANAGLGTTNEGYAGSVSTRYLGSGRSSGGGGGAGQLGQGDGTGGNGLSSDIILTSTGVYRAGGGGGGVGINPAIAATTGGNGGGGNGGVGYLGAVSPVPTAGTANTGGGGGGAGTYNISPAYAASGGSGIVILRWLTASASLTVGVGLTTNPVSSNHTDGLYSIREFTNGSGTVTFA